MTRGLWRWHEPARYAWDAGSVADVLVRSGLPLSELREMTASQASRFSIDGTRINVDSETWAQALDIAARQLA